MSQRPKVFVVNKSTHDFSAAEVFGDVVFLSKNNLQKYSTSQAYRTFYPILSHSNSEDYLIISGLTMHCMVAAFILTNKHKRLNLLLFTEKKNKKQYLERVIIGDNYDTRTRRNSTDS